MAECLEERKMVFNEETKKILVRSGLGWVLKEFPDEKVRTFVVDLIDLESLGIRPKGIWLSTGFCRETRVFLFDGDGRKIAEVGGEQSRPARRWGFDFAQGWPFFFKYEDKWAEETTVIETVDQTLRRLEDDKIRSVRFIVEIPIKSSSELKIHKLRKGDRDLATRLREKVDEAVDAIKNILEE